MRIVIAGGSGFLGHALTERLLRDGHEVVILSRGHAEFRQTLGLRTVSWSPNGEAGPWASEIDGAGAVVNLAGAGMADKRWSRARKQLLHDSRIHSTRSLAAAARQAAVKPGVFIQGSAMGFYGANDTDEEFDESSGPGSDFLATLCVAWEAEARPIAALGSRLVFIRTGLALSRHGGALAKMLPPFRMFVGGRIGSGRQYMSWIHLDDWVGIVTWAIENPAVEGPVNAVAPQAVTNTDFTRALGRALHRPSIMPVPAIAMKLAFGEMAENMLLLGQRLRPRRAMELGYRFRFENLDEAMRDAVR